jgi:type I restriction enzyme S subunit
MLRSVPYLRVANVQRGYLDLVEIKQIEATEEEIQELRLYPGDILFNEGGDRDKLGRGWIWRGEIPECIHQNHVFRARLYVADLQPQLISWYGNSFGQRYFVSEGKQTTNLASINLTKLGALPIPLPPVEEQRRIVAEIETQFTRLDATVTALQRVQANLKRYRASVLQAACEGRLVPTEAELTRTEGRIYEPADQLLQRILQERRAKWESEQLTKMKAEGKVPKDDRWKSKYVEPVKPDTSELPKLPEGWVWTSVEQLLLFEPRSLQSGPFGSNLLHSEFQHTGVLAIGIDNVLEGRFSMGSQHRISLEKYEQLEKYAARPLDVLITL